MADQPRVWWCAIDANGGWATYEELKARNAVAQGWPDEGDLSRLVGKPRDEIAKVVGKENGLDRVFSNILTAIRPGDLIIGIEGTQVKGACEVLRETQYVYKAKYEYAHSLYPVYWVDWRDVSPSWTPDGVPRRGVKGIAALHNNAETVRRKWLTYKRNVLNGTFPWAGEWPAKRLRELPRLKPTGEASPIDNRDIGEQLDITTEREAGFQSNPLIRRAIEEYAMGRAEKHLKRLLGQTPKDVSKSKPYDFLCNESGTELYVEVKGTQADGNSVFLSPNEVKHVQTHENSALFIVHSVKVKGTRTRNPVVSGGEEVYVHPRYISTGTLKPYGYVFSRNKRPEE